MRNILLAVDIGTTNVKSVLFELSGIVVAQAHMEYSTRYPEASWAEQDPEDWWWATKETIKRVIDEACLDSSDVRAIGVSSQAPTVVLVDRNGHCLRPALIWMDRRSENQCNWIRRNIGEKKIAEITYNRVDPFYVAPKLLWIKDREPEVFAKTYKILQANGYINYKLTGTFTMDISHRGLFGFFDYRQRKWSEKLSELMGIPLEKLPEVYECTEVIGEVTKEAAKELSLRQGIPVVAGAVDGAAAALGAGVSEPGQVAEMTGTSSVVLICLPKPVSEPSLILMDHVLPDAFLHLGAMVSTGGSLKWFRDQLGSVEVQNAEVKGIDPFDMMNLEAEKVEPGSGGLIFLPYMLGERSPIWNTNARGVILGLSLATTRAQLIRMIMEGSAYGLYHNIQVAENAGDRVKELRVVGGGAKSSVWNQIKADVTNRPVIVPESSLGTPLGGAILAGVGVGLYPSISEAVKKIVKRKVCYEPRPDIHQRYEAFYQIYRSIYENLKEDFNHLAKVNLLDKFKDKNDST